MVKVMMYGCNGYMGHVICNLIKDMENVTVAAGIDPCPGDQKDFPVFASLDECNVDVDVIIDFSAAVAAVSYTHLDVYKRQYFIHNFFWTSFRTVNFINTYDEWKI